MISPKVEHPDDASARPVPMMSRTALVQQWRRHETASDRVVTVGIGVALVLDALSAWLAFYCGHALRYNLALGGRVDRVNWEPFATFYRPAGIAVVLTLLVFSFRGTYRLRRWRTVIGDIPRVISGFTTVMAGAVMLAFFLKFYPSRLVFLYAWLIGIVLMIGHRAVFTVIQRELWERGIGVDRVLVAGSGENARRALAAVANHPRYGYKVVGYVDDDPDVGYVHIATEQGASICRRLGELGDLTDIVRRRDVDEVIIALPAEQHTRLLGLLEQCRRATVRFRIIPDFFQLSLDDVDLSEVAGVPIIGVRDGSIRGWQAFTKRAIDIAFSIAVLVLTLPLMGLIALMIKRDSPGRVLYRQQRIGKHGRPFEMLKFRCMVADADERRAEMLDAQPMNDRRLFKDPDDPRRTRIGRKLRRTSLDELPQFWNVLKGEMSVIGPRPPLPEEVETYDDWHTQRLLVKPGLTGLWQINGRSQLTFDEMVRLDLYYAEHWSPWLDTKIILRTIPAVVQGRGAW